MNHMRISVIVPPPVKPVSLADVYSELRLDPTGSPPTHPDDAALNRLIAAATDYVEQYTRRALVKQTIKLTHRRFPSDRYHFRAQETLWSEPGYDYDVRPRHIELLRPNLLTLTSVQYYDQQNALQTIDPSWYLVHSDQQVASIELLEGYFWPVTYIREDAVVLTYDAGYAPIVTVSPPSTDYVSNIPEGIKQAILIHVRMNYDQQTKDDRQNTLDAIDSLLTSFRSFNF